MVEMDREVDKEQEEAGEDSQLMERKKEKEKLRGWLEDLHLDEASIQRVLSCFFSLSLPLTSLILKKWLRTEVKSFLNKNKMVQ